MTVGLGSYEWFEVQGAGETQAYKTTHVQPHITSMKELSAVNECVSSEMFDNNV